MAQFRDEAVALRSFRLGEADRVVSFITPEHGKVRAVAKGVRKTKSRIGARVEPPSHVSLLCWRGRELDVVTQVEILDSFRSIREDLERLSAVLSMLEIVDHVSLERHAAPELFSLLVRALRALEERYSPMMFSGFALKLLAVEGVGPVVDECVSCASAGPLVSFDAQAGGLLCANCRRGVAVSEESVELVQAVLGGGLSVALAAPASPATEGAERIVIVAIENHLDRRLRSRHHLFDHGARPA